MQIARWGNSLAVRLPSKLLQELQLKEGDNLEVHATGAKTFEFRKQITREEALEALNKHSFHVPAGYKFKREDAYPDGEY
jgi:antitoxin MazE